MIRTDAEYKKAQEKLDQERETLRRQREQLEEMDLSDEEVERALEPLISFRNQLREEIETYEQVRRGDLSALHDLRSIRAVAHWSPHCEGLVPQPTCR